MPQAVNIVVTCTKRKTRPAGPFLRLRGIGGTSPEERTETWLRRLQEAEAEPVRAEELYAGDHWSVARSLADVAANAGTEVKLWVCSAGYGLIPTSARVAPYSATFSRSHPDSICNGFEAVPREIHARWWRALSDWDGPVNGAPRTIRALADRWPATPVLVVASSSYLWAMQEDLVDAVNSLEDSDTLSILSAGTERLPRLDQHLLRVDARLRQIVGGGMMSLNARIAREILDRGWPLRTSRLNGELNALQQGLAKPVRPGRSPKTDDEVSVYIRQELLINVSATWSALLRKLRDELGWACEQKRFKALFLAVRSTL